MSQTPSEKLPSVNPRFAAQHIAKLLDADPVMAALVKEFIAPQRLREVLDIPDESMEIEEEP